MLFYSLNDSNFNHFYSDDKSKFYNYYICHAYQHSLIQIFLLYVPRKIDFSRSSAIYSRERDMNT